MQSSDIAVSLTLERAPARTIAAKLIFSNTGAAPTSLWLPLTFPEAKINAERFVVTIDNAPLEYEGRTVKRGAPRLDEFVELVPGQAVQSWVPLNQAYQFPGRGVVKVRFEAINPSLDGSRLEALVSNTAELTLP